jgi:predicted MFS family arabinose efflux permease
VNDTGDRSTLERNLRLYDWFLPLSSVYFWTPVYFLYFSERFPIAAVLQLDAIYYLAVVLLEVPSGYFSDRVGRRATLLVSTAAMVAGYALFLWGGHSFALFALAQVALAAGYAFLSGTTTSFHFDTLSALGREAQFGDREAHLARNGFRCAAGAAVVAGATGVASLAWPFFLALCNAGILFALSLVMREPAREDGGFADDGLLSQLKQCLQQLRQPFLFWVFAYFVLSITTEHIPYEFAQPYLAQVLGETIDQLRFTPLASGLLFAGISFVASVVASRSMRLRRRLGLTGALLGVGAAQIALIGVMAAVVSPLAVPLLLFRGSQAALSNPIIHAAVTPRVPQAQRATFLSLHSLAGRLGFGIVLFGLGGLAGGGSVDDPATLRTLLGAAATISLLGWAALALTRSAASEP